MKDADREARTYDKPWVGLSYAGEYDRYLHDV